MNDKNNSIPRNGTPLFFPEDPENGFSSGSSGITRRKFLKRSGGATSATLIAWSIGSQAANATPPSESESEAFVEIEFI
jgi:hypothetical protein